MQFRGDMVREGWDIAGVLDGAAVSGLVAAVGREVAGEIVACTIDEVVPALAAVASAASLDHTRRAAHVLVSCAGNVGLASLSAAARRLEHACLGGDTGQADEARRALLAGAPAAIAALRALAGSLGQGAEFPATAQPSPGRA